MTARSTIAYQPALDGVRALAVIAVLLFHGGVVGFDGGYLGVSVFFTLSGYLITSLLMQEHDRTGRIDLATFYARRVRRLLPAGLLCVAGVAAFAATTDLFDGVVDLRAHVVGALLQVANWVFLAGDGSYQDLLARTAGTSSPLEHFWSLAIEEQFYWIWPPVMLLLLSRVPRRRGRIVVIAGMTAIAAAAAPAIAVVWGADAAYWATPARIGEILMGALLAVVLTGRRVPDRLGLLAPIAVAVLAGAIVLFPTRGGPAYSGALPLIAVVSATLILGLQAPSRVRRVLERPALVGIGRISYGLYLFHWPVFLIVHPDRVDVPGWALLPVRLSVTFVIAAVSYWLVEQPIRLAPRLTPAVTFTGALASTVVLLAVASTSVSPGLGEYWSADSATAAAASIDETDAPLQPLRGAGAARPVTDAQPNTAPVETPSPSEPDDATEPTVATGVFDRIRGGAAISPVTSTDVPTTVPPSTVPPTVPTTVSTTVSTTVPTSTVSSTVPALPPLSRPVRIVVIGDSTAKAIGTGLVTWAADHPELAQVEVVSAPGCGFVEGGERRIGDTIGPIEGCDGWVEQFVDPAVERLRPDVVVAMVTSWDLIDRRWDTDDLLSPLDRPYADRIRDDYRQLADDLADLGVADVAFVRHPIPDVYWLPRTDAQEDPARHAVVYDVYETLAADDDRVHVVELDRWLTAQGLAESEEVRPDGIHLTPESATQIATDYLGDQLLRIALGVPRP